MSIQLTPEEMRRLLCDELEKTDETEKPLTAYQRERLTLDRERIELQRLRQSAPKTHHNAPQSETASNIKLGITLVISSLPLLITLITAIVLLLRIS